VQAFGDQLGPDEDVGAAALEIGDDLSAGALARGGVAVEAQPRVREAADLQLQPLRARAGEAQLRGAAGRARVRRAGAIPAVVAEVRLLGGVEDERDPAVRAADPGTAGPALRVGREAAAIEEEEHLVAPLERLAGRQQRGAINASARRARRSSAARGGEVLKSRISTSGSGRPV
jgi:hypothetical protein